MAHKGQRFEWQNLIPDVGNSGTIAVTTRRHYAEKAISKAPITRIFSIEIKFLKSGRGSSTSSPWAGCCQNEAPRRVVSKVCTSRPRVGLGVGSGVGSDGLHRSVMQGVSPADFPPWRYQIEVITPNDVDICPGRMQAWALFYS